MITLKLAVRSVPAGGVRSSPSVKRVLLPQHSRRRSVSTSALLYQEQPERRRSGSVGCGPLPALPSGSSAPLYHRQQRFSLNLTGVVGAPHSRRSCFHSTSRPSFPDKDAIADLFEQHAKKRDGEWNLDAHDICELLFSIGREGCLTAEHGTGVMSPNSFFVEQLIRATDADGNGFIELEEFLDNYFLFIGDNPARIILVVGGPGSGKGVLSDRLQKECNVIHLSSGDLLRQEVEQGTALGHQVRDTMARGELVSSAVMVALMKKRMKNHPGKRVLLDGFPRSLENAHDLVKICGKPELALHLVCDDTILMERIMKRKASRSDDNFETALSRIRTYHRFQPNVMEWLRQQHIPIVNLDSEGDPDSVWRQMTAIGKLMRPAVRITGLKPQENDDVENPEEDWTSPLRSPAI